MATPEAQMLGATRFSVGVLPRARREVLLPAWERFALPLHWREASGGGSLPDRGSFLQVEGAELSSIRRVDGRVEVRVWNPSTQPARARVAGETVELRPAEIRTLRLP